MQVVAHCKPKGNNLFLLVVVWTDAEGVLYSAFYDHNIALPVGTNVNIEGLTGAAVSPDSQYFARNYEAFQQGVQSNQSPLALPPPQPRKFNTQPQTQQRAPQPAAQEINLSPLLEKLDQLLAQATRIGNFLEILVQQQRRTQTPPQQPPL